MLSYLLWLGLGTLGAYASAINSSSVSVTCAAIGRAVSSASDVYYPGSAQYDADNFHWLPSSSEVSACSVEPGTAEDVAIILKILAVFPSRFAIKSHGHASDAGVSSTTGVQISLNRLDSVTIGKGSITMGVGQAWTTVYAKLHGTGLGVAGARIVNVGIGGYILGGGYAWTSNRYGMAIDSVISFELVLPTAKIVTVSASSYPDLFAGLKGGFNNFGIVTKVTMRSYHQGLVWGGTITYAPKYAGAVWDAVAAWNVENNDPDGNILSAYRVNPDGSRVVFVLLYYNAPKAPKGFFDIFTRIPSVSSITATYTFLDYIVATSGAFDNTARRRGEFSSISFPAITRSPVDTAVAQMNYYGVGGPGSFDNSTIFQFVLEPFRSVVVNKNLSAAAYPHNIYVSPTNIWLAWNSSDHDAAAHTAIRAASTAIRSSIAASGMDASLPLYPNYALSTEPVASMYGVNLPWLKALRKKYDPAGVMLRTGGIKFV